MRIFFSLIISSLMLAVCHACYVVPFDLMAKKGEVLPPNTCADAYDGKFHLTGSSWIAEDCFQCNCNSNGLYCCHRKFREIPECKVVVNRWTCEPEYYRLDDPSQRCDV